MDEIQVTILVIGSELSKDTRIDELIVDKSDDVVIYSHGVSTTDKGLSTSNVSFQLCNTNYGKLLSLSFVRIVSIDDQLQLLPAHYDIILVVPSDTDYLYDNSGKLRNTIARLRDRATGLDHNTCKLPIILSYPDVPKPVPNILDNIIGFTTSYLCTCPMDTVYRLATLILAKLPNSPIFIQRHVLSLNVYVFMIVNPSESVPLIEYIIPQSAILCKHVVPINPYITYSINTTRGCIQISNKVFEPRDVAVMICDRHDIDTITDNMLSLMTFATHVILVIVTSSECTSASCTYECSSYKSSIIRRLEKRLSRVTVCIPIRDTDRNTSELLIKILSYLMNNSDIKLIAHKY